VALKKSDLYRSLWQSCDELRGGMDASQYKDYILTLLFVKYVTDKKKSDPNSLIEVPDGGSFDDMVALKGNVEIGEGINTIIARLAEENGLVGVIDLADFGDEEKLGRGKEMQDRLSKLVAIFADLDFSGSRAEGDDLLGDAYEYLMRHFATESGKSKGQFYTPAEVSRVVAKIVGIGPGTSQDQRAYDPTCGSGSLLLKVAAEAPGGITLYGQEKDNATWALARMNLILHNKAEDVDGICKGDTITSPQLVEGDRLRTFDFAVANPPFSEKSWSNGLENEYRRFEYGRPPEKNGDYAFLLHVLKSLNSTGKAAVILPHGVLFRGNAEAAIRRELLRRGFIKGIVGLPPNLFYGTGIPACIVVLDKENAAARKGVFMIDASRGFIKDGPKNRLRNQDIHKIVDIFNKRTEIDCYSRMVPIAEIASEANVYNLNIPRYIDSSEPEDIQDLHAHLHGGIPDRDIDALGAFWEAFPSLHAALFKPNRPGYSDLSITIGEVQQAILDSAEFRRFSADISAGVAEWFAAHRPALASITAETRPSVLIATLGDDLLARYRNTPLLDEYDIYEQLLTYWDETMHDDVFLIMHHGWLGAAKPRKAIVNKDRKLSEMPDLVLGGGKNAEKFKTDLIPPALIVARWFADEQAHLDQLINVAEEAARAVGEYTEEHAVEEGLLWEAVEDGKVTKALAAARLKEAKHEKADAEEIATLQQAVALFDAESAAKKAAKNAQAALDLATLKKYGDLTEADVKELVLDAKWKATVFRRVDGVLTSLILDLVARIWVLRERYGETLEEVRTELADLERRVNVYLAHMDVQLSRRGMGVSTYSAVNEGIMQQVLTGETRLPGFAGTWSEVRLGEIANIKTGSRNNQDKQATGRYPFYVRSATVERIDTYSYNCEAILVPGEGGIGSIFHYIDGKFEVHQRVYKISQFDSGIVGKFVYYYMKQCFGHHAMENSVKATVDSLRLPTFVGFAMRIPEDVDEQRAIVAVLDDNEAEIGRLQLLLVKAAAIKQGMMQELLTGRTRLPVVEGVAT
jgi:type I restriction enzyme M protein